MNETSSQADPLIGHELLGTYQIVEMLGKGGMSVVYRGRHLVTDQAVAIKVLPPDLVSQAEVKARFIAEARTLARLEHPNIVTLHNFLQEAGHLYIVMQFAEGETFDQVIAREGWVPAADVVAVGIETLSALVYAHERDVIHRDIKPSNIILRGDGAVKVMDFGIAKIVGSSKLTQTGQTMGTVRYMSPEQVRGKHIDHRTDLYSLGVALYEACTGRTPFDGDTHFEIMHKHLTETPVPPGERADIPQALDEAIVRALSKRPEERFQSARDFRDALRHVPLATPSSRVASSASLPRVRRASPAHQASDRPLRSRRANLLQVGVAAIVLVASVAGVLWAVLTGNADRHSPAGSRTPYGATGLAMSSWPEPQEVARQIAWKVDHRFERERLRVMSTKKIDVAAIAEIYRRARKAYTQYLREEGIDLQVRIGPLNLAIVPQGVFRRQGDWLSPRYDAPSETLYVSNAKPDYLRTDLPHGLALHFCVPIAQFSNRRCLDLAEGFEAYLQHTRTVDAKP